MSRKLNYGKPKVYTEEVERYIIEHSDFRNQDLTELVNERFGYNLSVSAVAHKRSRLLSIAPKKSKKRHQFTNDQEDWIKMNALGIPNSKLTIMFNEKFGTELTESSIEHKKMRLGVNSGIDKKFSPKHECGEVYQEKIVNSYEWIINMNRVDEDRGNYKKRYAIWCWEVQNGPLPKGMTVWFKDGNTLNCEIKNLVLISRTELIQMKKVFHTDMLNEHSIPMTKLMIALRKAKKESYKPNCEPVDKKKCIELHEKGVSSFDIAYMLKCNQNTVLKILRKDRKR